MTKFFCWCKSLLIFLYSNLNFDRIKLKIFFWFILYTKMYAYIYTVWLITRLNTLKINITKFPSLVKITRTVFLAITILSAASLLEIFAFLFNLLMYFFWLFSASYGNFSVDHHLSYICHEFSLIIQNNFVVYKHSSLYPFILIAKNRLDIFSNLKIWYLFLIPFKYCNTVLNRKKSKLTIYIPELCTFTLVKSYNDAKDINHYSFWEL